MAALIIAMALVRPQANFLVISKSGNNSQNNLFAWSLARKARLCLAINIAHKDSALMVKLLLSGLKRFHKLRSKNCLSYIFMFLGLR